MPQAGPAASQRKRSCPRSLPLLPNSTRRESSGSHQEAIMAGKKKGRRVPSRHDMQMQAARPEGSLTSTVLADASIRDHLDQLPQELRDALSETLEGNPDDNPSMAYRLTGTVNAQLWQQQQQQEEEDEEEGEQGGLRVRYVVDTAGRGNSGTSHPISAAPELVAQLSSSNQESAQACLLQDINSFARAGKGHRLALLSAGILPLLLRLLQSSNQVLQGEAFAAMSQLKYGLSSEADLTPSIKSIIPRLVMLVQSNIGFIQQEAVEWLAHMGSISPPLDHTIIAAGAIPALTGALRKGPHKARLLAAGLLMHLATVSGTGMELEFAIAGAVPVAVSAIECANPDEQAWAALILNHWCNKPEVTTVAVEYGAVAAALSLSQSQTTEAQQAAAALLSRCIHHGDGGGKAVREAAIPAAVALLESSDLSTRLSITQVLARILSMGSQETNIAAATAGAIPSLVRSAVRTTSAVASQWCYSIGPLSNNPTGDSSDGDKGCIGRNMRLLPPEELSQLSQGCHTSAIMCLSNIATEGDSKCRRACVAKGAVAVFCAAMHKDEHERARQDGFLALCALLDDANSREAAAAQLVSLLRNSKLPKRQAHALYAVQRLVRYDKNRIAVMDAAGGLAALASVMRTALGLAPVRLAASASSRHPLAVMEAGATPLLAQLLQDSPRDAH